MTNYYPPSSIGPTDVGPYRLVRMIGEGGMGAVYYALRRSDNLAVALKILPRSLAMDNDQLARFRREAAVAMGLDHPNVVGCIDVDQSDGYNFMVMEFVGGGDAEELLRRSGGKISERRAMSISLDITKALHHASSFGLVHRDIKPENLLFTESGMAKLTDFGLVKRTAENLRITERGKAMGTPHFMAPEQARGKRDLDVRSDIYSLGATIYYLLSGLTPYNGNSAFEIVSQLASEPPPPLSNHRPDLSPSCLFIIECMMARELEDRPQSAKDLLVMIEAYFNGRQIPHPRDLTKPEKPAETPAEPRKGDTHNPMKKLKAAEFQSAAQSNRPAQPGDIPPNTITRHFMTSPTRIMTKGGAAPPPPSPETVSMPSAGTKVPLIKQNEGRRPAAAGPAPTPADLSPAARAPQPAPPTAALRSASSQVPSPSRTVAPPPNTYPPAALPMGIPLGQPFPGDGFPPQAYPPSNESGEQIAVDLDRPLPSMQYPLTPPAGVAAGTPGLPLAGRADTAFVGRPPTPGASPFESGELLAEEGSSTTASPTDAPQAPTPAYQVPGPVTARFRIQEPPPEAYIDDAAAPVEEAETPPPEAYIQDAQDGNPPAPTDRPAPEFAAAPEEVNASPSADGSGVATPVASSEPSQPLLDTPPEIIERIALQGSSTITPAVAIDPMPTAEPIAASDQPAAETTAEPPPTAHSEEAAPASIDQTADTAAAPMSATAPTTTTEPPMVSSIGVSPAELETTPPPSGSESLEQATPTATALTPIDTETASAATFAITPPAQESAVEPSANTAAGTDGDLRAETAVEAPNAAPVDPALDSAAEPAVAAVNSEVQTDTKASAPMIATPLEATPMADASNLSPATPAPPTLEMPTPTAVQPALAPAQNSPPASEPAIRSFSDMPAALPPASSAAIPTTETDTIDPNSLLARVRRLQSADTMLHEVPLVSAAPSPAPEEAPANSSSAWKYLALGFIGGVLITLALVLLMR